MLEFFRRLPSKKRSNYVFAEDDNVLATETAYKFNELYNACLEIKAMKKQNRPEHEIEMQWYQIEKLMPELNKRLLRLAYQKEPLPLTITQDKLKEIFRLKPALLDLCSYPNITERLKGRENRVTKAKGKAFYKEVNENPKFETERNKFKMYWKKSSSTFNFETKLRALDVEAKLFSNYREAVIDYTEDERNHDRRKALDTIIDLDIINQQITKLQAEKEIIRGFKDRIKDLSPGSELYKKQMKRLEVAKVEFKKAERILFGQTNYKTGKIKQYGKIDLYIMAIESAMNGKVNRVLLDDLGWLEKLGRKQELHNAYRALQENTKTAKGEKAPFIVHLEAIKPYLVSLRDEFHQRKKLKWEQKRQKKLKGQQKVHELSRPSNRF